MRHPTFQHQADDFWAVYKRSTCAVERRRSQLLALLAEGKPSAEVLAITRYSYQGANKIVDAYEAQGLESLKDQRHGNRGAPTLLSDADLLLLAQSIRADVAEGGVWNGNRVQEWVKTTLQKDLYLSRCYELLDVKIIRGDRQLSIADTLDLTVSEAVRLFSEDREVQRVLQPIVDVGLDYVRLGQPVPTLSGGEAQRLKLAGFLAEAVGTPAQRLARKGTLYLFDEPTTGLHFDDIAKLMRALRKLLDAGHSIIVIEHNLDVIRAADWVIDLGPEGGEAGGELLFAGTAEDIRHHPLSHTGRALVDYEVTLGISLEAREKPSSLPLWGRG